MVRAAWGASIVAQALLLVAMLRAGRRDWWTAYLAFGIARTALLWPLGGAAYWWAWLATEPLAVGLQFLAVGDVVRGASRPVLHVGGIVAASAFTWSLMLTDEAWPLLRRGGLALHQAGSYACLGLLSAPLVYGGDTSAWMLALYAIRAARAVAEQATAFRTAELSAAYLAATTILFCGWSFSLIRGGKSARYAR